jgi:hypothetical protein
MNSKCLKATGPRVLPQLMEVIARHPKKETLQLALNPIQND